MEKPGVNADGPVIDASDLSADELKRIVAERGGMAGSAESISDQSAAAPRPPFHITGAVGREHLLMALDAPVDLVVDGPLGDYAFALNRQAKIRVEGSVGDGVAEGMSSGSVRIRGDAGVGAGVAIRGGTLAIYGAAAANCGAALQGGEVFVRGNVGRGAAAGAVGGTVVIGGDAAEGLGDAMQGTTIFIRGKIASLGRGVREAPLRERERLRLGLLLINAGIRGDVKDFRRIVSQLTLQEEARKPRGEVDPSWR